MANISKAERHNRMLNKTFDFYHNHQNNLPSCHLYSRYLEIAREKLSVSIEDARIKYGLYTVKEWETLLNLGWNKNN